LAKNYKNLLEGFNESLGRVHWITSGDMCKKVASLTSKGGILLCLWRSFKKSKKKLVVSNINFDSFPMFFLSNYTTCCSTESRETTPLNIVLPYASLYKKYSNKWKAGKSFDEFPRPTVTQGSQCGD
jgi:hypothetical protein